MCYSNRRDLLSRRHHPVVPLTASGHRTRGLQPTASLGQCTTLSGGRAHRMRRIARLAQLAAIHAIRSVASTERRVPKDEAQPAAHVPNKGHELVSKELRAAQGLWRVFLECQCGGWPQ
jgi:hypothetical protein